MRKDFLVDPYQVLEARAAGAGGVLVILRMLPRDALEALVDEALDQQMFVLLETFDAAEIDLARALLDARRGHDGRLLVGVNCRDLVTLQVVPGRLEALASRLPQGAPRVAESGVATPADAARMAQAGYDLALVGSALMAGGEPRELAAACSRRRARRSAAGRAVACRAEPGRTDVDQGLRHDEPEAVEAALAAGVDAIGFVFARSVRRVEPRAGARTRARRRAAGSPASRSRSIPSRGCSRRFWRCSEPDLLQTDALDLARWRPARCAAACCRWCARARPCRGRCRRGCCSRGRSAAPARPPTGRARELAGRVELVLAGGLRPANVAAAIAARAARSGVDVSSGVESQPGVKSPALILEFVEAARAAFLEHER
jgi:hypothetical protein